RVEAGTGQAADVVVGQPRYEQRQPDDVLADGHRPGAQAEQVPVGGGRAGAAFGLDQDVARIERGRPAVAMAGEPGVQGDPGARFEVGEGGPYVADLAGRGEVGG